MLNNYKDLDAAICGVPDEAPELRGLELGGLGDEGETVHAAARCQLLLQRAQLPPCVVARAEAHLNGAPVLPPALPQVAPPARECPRADGLLEGDVRQDAPPQVVWQSRDAIHRDQIRIHRLTSVPLLIYPLLLRSATGAGASAGVGADRHFPLVPQFGEDSGRGAMRLR